MKDISEQWDSQVSFMSLLQQHRNFPQFPVDISSKSGQKIIKDVIHEAQHEAFEAIQHLKNTKSHRLTEIPDVAIDDFIEEIVDAQKYLLEALLLAGVSYEKWIAIFNSKTNKNIDRILNGY